MATKRKSDGRLARRDAAKSRAAPPATSLVQIDKLMSQLANVESLGDLMEVRAKADAIHQYIRQHIKTPGQAASETQSKLRLQNAVGRVRCWIERRGGELLREIERKKPPGKMRSTVEPISPLRAAEREVGGRTAAHRMQLVAAMPESRFRDLVDGDKAELTLTMVRREARQHARRKTQKREAAAGPLPGGKFRTIVADPPWDWGDEGDHEQLGRGTTDYPTMPLADIVALPVADRAADNAHLYLWITNRSLPKGFQIINAWGFRYITCITWAKPSIGMGNYFRGSTEHLLFGVRGSLAINRKDAGTWFSAKRGKGGHSSKPPEAYELIESCSPGPYLEMFARDCRDGWSGWGADL